MSQNHSFNRPADLSIFVLGADGGTITETVESKRFDRMSVDDRARLLASVIEQAWELARDYDESGECPIDASVRDAIQQYWSRKSDGDACICCGSDELNSSGACDRCGV